MINSNRSNLRQLTKRKRLKEIHENYGPTTGSTRENPKLTPDQQREIKDHIEQIKKRRRFAQVVSLVVTLIIVLLMAFLLITADISGILEVIN